MTEPAFSWESATATHVGKVREVNEDACLALPRRGLWVVADGMGGHEAGDVASRMIVEALSEVHKHANPADFLDEVEDKLLDVNMNLYELSAPQSRTVGSTVVALLVMGQHVVIIWAGDSRAYRLRGDRFEKMTVDHSQVEMMVQSGELRPEDAERHPLANVITRAVGGTEDLYLDVELRQISDGDRYLLCSDGLYKDIDEPTLASCLASGSSEAACDALITRALAGQASDNVTVAVVEFHRNN